MSPAQPMTPDEARRLASLEAKHDAHVDNCGERWELLRADLAGIRNDVSAIKITLAQAKGGWRALAAAGAIGGAIMAGATKILPFVVR